MKREVRILNLVKLLFVRKSYREIYFLRVSFEGIIKEELSGEWRCYVEIVGVG